MRNRKRYFSKKQRFYNKTIKNSLSLPIMKIATGCNFINSALRIPNSEL